MNIKEYLINDSIIDAIIKDYEDTLGPLTKDKKISSKKRYNYNWALKGGNFACAYYTINNEAKKYIAHSAFNKPNELGLLNMFEDRYIIGYRPDLIERQNNFITQILDEECSDYSLKYSRSNDTESKIFEQIAHEFKINNIQKDVIKDITIWTRRYPCPSCRCVIKSFEEKYNINVTIYYERKEDNNPCDEGVGCQ
ncbi:deaminase domain-containing protein [Priestia megaterium]|uniref:deaminase domain-containing protein n=1 Tax=Priestia megaterium TaxID=1404 RepID=UPI002E21D804|nr:deaminase domain-containing protein [Priestia megaterium]